MIFLRPVRHGDGELFCDTSYAAMPPDAMDQMINESALNTHDGDYFELFAVMTECDCVGFVSVYECAPGTVSCGPEIKPQYRKQGYAYYAVSQVLEYAGQSGFVKAAAQVRRDNFASIALHRKLAFSVCGEHTNRRGNAVLSFEKVL